MKHTSLLHRQDPQRERPWVFCSVCGAAIYRGGAYWQVNGEHYCACCLDTLARREFAAHLRICGEEEER